MMCRPPSHPLCLPENSGIQSLHPKCGWAKTNGGVKVITKVSPGEKHLVYRQYKGSTHGWTWVPNCDLASISDNLPKVSRVHMALIQM